MCVGRPARIVHVAGMEAMVETGEGRKMRAALALPEPVHTGDFVLLFGDTVLSRIDRRSALETLRTLGELAASTAKEDGRSVREVERLYERRVRRLASAGRGTK